MRNRGVHRRRAGKTLIEVVLVVTGIAALLATAGTTLHAVRRVGLAATAAAGSGVALGRLHRALSEDAAAADSAAVRDGVLVFTRPDGGSITYAADGGAVTRTVGDAGGRGERYAVGAANAAFAADGGRASVAFDRAGTPDGARDGHAVEVVAYVGGAE